MNKNSLLLVLPILITLIGCQNNDEVSKMTWLSDEQKSSIRNIKKIDEEGYVFEQFYKADYKLDEVLSKDTWSEENVKLFDQTLQTILTPESQYSLERYRESEDYAACSAFYTKSNDNHYIIGRNYDWDIGDNIQMIVHTNPSNGYASIGMSDVGFYQITRQNREEPKKIHSLIASPYAMTDGINSEGLSVSVLLLEEKAFAQNTGKTRITSSLVVRMLLDKCSTVLEAENLLRQYDVCSCMYSSDLSFHWIVGDAEGNKAVFEYVENQLVVNKCTHDVDYDTEDNTFEIDYSDTESDYLIVTNFYLAKNFQNTKGIGYWRYEKLHDLLTNNSRPSIDEAMEYCKAVKFYKNDQEVYSMARIIYPDVDPNSDSIWVWFSEWSIIYDCTAKKMNLCARENYTKLYVFNVN